MTKKFKVGNKFTVAKQTWAMRDTTADTVYTAIHVGKGHGQDGGESILDVQFIDDVGDKVVAHCIHLKLVSE